MTQRDRWKKRPVVLRYWEFKDHVRALGIKLPVPYKITFFLPMPKSWPEKKKREMAGKPHMQKPDKDNLEKALLDALYEDDAHVWSGWVEKRWSRVPGIRVEPLQ